MGWVKWVGWSVLALLLLALARYVHFCNGDQLLSGLTIGGEPLPADAQSALRVLRARAAVWSATPLQVSVGDELAGRSVMRSELSAVLPAEAVLAAARQAGRSGNPLVDFHKWFEAQRGQLDVRWLPEFDRARLSAFVDQLQQRFEQPPVAGITDGPEFTLPGRDGRGLDHATAEFVLSRALRTGALTVLLPWQRVAAPAPIALGPPDGALFDQESEPVAREVPSSPSHQSYEPRSWLPASENDCYESSSQRAFCDGPRKVPSPFGAAQALAAELGLGQLDTIAQLIRHAPAPAWVRAAGGPLDEHSLTWPVDEGKLGRGFGYVRKAELRDRIHAGLDIVAPRGSLIRASARGIVAYSDNRVRGYGNLLAIVHDNGAVTLSAHCQRVFVFAGQRVERGQAVAEVGMTGLAMGPHLHFEYHVGGAATDPASLFAPTHGSPNAR